MQNIKRKFDAVVLGISAGGFDTITKVLQGLNPGFPIPAMIVQHTEANNTFDFYIEHLKSFTNIKIKVADDKEPIVSGCLYIAPANYHLLVETDKILSLNIDEKVNYSRPSIDVLFETAADVYKEKLLGIVLTGANNDGTNGARIIKEYGGYIIAQDPDEAVVPNMPYSVIANKLADEVLSIKDINSFLKKLK